MNLHSIRRLCCLCCLRRLNLRFLRSNHLRRRLLGLLDPHVRHDLTHLHILRNDRRLLRRSLLLRMRRGERTINRLRKSEITERTAAESVARRILHLRKHLHRRIHIPTLILLHLALELHVARHRVHRQRIITHLTLDDLILRHARHVLLLRTLIVRDQARQTLLQHHAVLNAHVRTNELLTELLPINRQTRIRHIRLLPHRNLFELQTRLDLLVRLSNTLRGNLIILHSHKVIILILHSRISLRKHRDQHGHLLIRRTEPHHVHAIIHLRNLSNTLHHLRIRRVQEHLHALDVPSQDIRHDAQLLGKIDNRGARKTNDLRLARIRQKPIEQVGTLVVHRFVAETRHPTTWHNRLHRDLTLPPLTLGNVRDNLALHETREVVELVNHDDLVVEESIPRDGVHLTGIRLQLGRGNTIVANECDAGLDGGRDLLTDVVAFLRGQLGIIRRFREIGHPQHTALLGLTQTNAAKIRLTERQHRATIRQNGLQEPILLPRKRQLHPMVRHAEVTEATEGDLGHEIATQRKRRHHHDALVRCTIQRLRRSNRRTRLARSEAMIDQHTAVGGGVADVLTDELLIQEGLHRRTRLLLELRTGLFVDATLDLREETKDVAIVLVHEAVEALAALGRVDHRLRQVGVHLLDFLLFLLVVEELLREHVIVLLVAVSSLEIRTDHMLQCSHRGHRLRGADQRRYTDHGLRRCGGFLLWRITIERLRSDLRGERGGLLDGLDHLRTRLLQLDGLRLAAQKSADTEGLYRFCHLQTA